MAYLDPLTTQRDLKPDIAAELEAAGFDDAHEVGRGGFGTVYRCRQRSLDRAVAIKVLSTDLDEENRERFVREQRAMGRLTGHPNIVDILQVGTTPKGLPYIVMPYHSHGSLEARIRHQGPLKWGEALHVGVKLAGALETAHQSGTLHRDVKPANILLTGYGEPQLTDFGIARIAGGFETSTSAVTGSPAFTAPEVLRGHSAIAASDVYGLGATLFCLITGHAAYERRSGEQVVAQFLRMTSEPVPDLRPQDIPDDVCTAIERAMAEDPADRFVSAAEFGLDLREAERRNGLVVDRMDLLTGVDVDESREEIGAKRHSPSITPPSASTKYRPPTSTRALVQRGRLIDILRADGRRRLTVIHAAAGFGKSTLAAQWRHILSGEGTSVAWLMIDNDDNNVVWFLAHLVEAIRRVQPTLANELGQALEEHGDDAQRYVLTSLINEIHDSRQRVAVVIDDWHLVTDAATIAAMEFLLDNGCHHLQVIVTSRTQAGLPMNRMRVRSELIEIDSDALRFDIAESRSLLVELGGLPLAEADVANLSRSTEGWVAALKLASLSLRDHGDPAELISHVSGRHHAIGGYLVENVLNTLEPATLDFLLTTSITERICGNLASALSHVDRGQARLEEVERRDLFLRPMDDDSEWFRYHRLFAEFLRQRLERDQPERISELHRTASRWFADHKYLSESVDHALAAGDFDRAANLVERDAMGLVEQSHMSTLLGLTAKLPPNLVISRPRLQLDVAWANVMLRRGESSQAALDLAYAAFDRSPLEAADVADLRAEADVLRGVLGVSSDQIDGAAELVSDCLSRPDRLRPWVVTVAADVATFVAIYTFDFDGARRRQDWASTYRDQAIGSFVTYGICFAGIAANEQLDIVAAEDKFREAVQLLRQSAGTHSHAARLAGALLGDLLYEKGNIAEAERLLDDSYNFGPEGGVVDFMMATYASGARIKALRGDLESAARRLDAGTRAAEALSLPRLAARIDNERVRWGLPVAPDYGNWHRASGPRRPGGNGILAMTAELQEDTAVRVLLAEQSPDQSELACARAQAMVDDLRGQGRPRAELRAELLLANCLSVAGRIDDAKHTLVPVASRCAEVGLTRFILDAGSQVIPLLEALRDDQRNGRWRRDWPQVPSSFLTDLLTATDH